MTDPRLFPGTDRIVWEGWGGEAPGRTRIPGRRMGCTRTVAPLAARPGGPRERELVLHEGFVVLEARDGWCFGFAERCGYVGWMRAADLREDPLPPTHVVATRQSYAFDVPELKAGAVPEPVSFGTRLAVGARHEGGRWGEAARLRTEDDGIDPHRTVYLPAAHLRPLDVRPQDPVAVAELFLGTPYLWGGNSGFGIDCSGLVQGALLACGIACPGDADLQEESVGEVLPEGEPPRRGDLLFWKGHVALMADAETILHANATDMAVAFEDLDAACARIAAAGDGPVRTRRRLG
ncbi:NlpC/P60 family protein [Wenxinia saemankumensis]|uniref:NlpC/P60 family protein n=1 Tax=Wenxinia saemankumensis TaxID=1447782 RepID=A0A1M6E2C8_9RHOB|nr:NlpC/P60 family protein [Wenxinia saemankumensis]SHI79530.1 NlpC/P60 family protein [Wenxinia saemankumensis]